MSHLQKRIKAGRPLKKNQQESGIEFGPFQDENVYIADDSDCERIFSLLARQSRYKNIIKTGPNKNKKVDEEQFGEVAENVKQSFEELQIKNLQYFFLSSKKRNYQFEDNKLIDKTQYKFIDETKFQSEFQTLIHKINIVNKELSEEFIQVLEEILIQYQTLIIQEEPKNMVIEKILQHIQNPENKEKFQYLLNWQKLKSITKEILIKSAVLDLNEKQEEINRKTSKKVKRKHQEFIERQKRELDQQNNLEPLQYLITNLIEAFNKICGNEQE